MLNEAMAILKEARPVLREQYAVKTLAIFGSVVRNEAGLQVCRRAWEVDGRRGWDLKADDLQ